MKSLCLVCGCTDFREGTITHTLRTGDHIFVVENVPALLCLRCEEPQLEAGVADALRRLVHGPHEASRTIQAEVLEYRAA